MTIDVSSESVYDVESFCLSHKISIPYFYKLLKSGNGPKIIKLGRRTLISKKAAVEWVDSLEKEQDEDYENE